MTYDFKVTTGWPAGSSFILTVADPVDDDIALFDPDAQFGAGALTSCNAVDPDNPATFCKGALFFLNPGRSSLAFGIGAAQLRRDELHQLSVRRGCLLHQRRSCRCDRWQFFAGHAHGERHSPASRSRAGELGPDDRRLRPCRSGPASALDRHSLCDGVRRRGMSKIRAFILAAIGSAVALPGGVQAA